MIIDSEVMKLNDELEAKIYKINEENKGNISSYLTLMQYSLEGRARRKLTELSHSVFDLEKQLEAEKNKAMVWKESYMEMVRQQAKLAITNGENK